MLHNAAEEFNLLWQFFFYNFDPNIIQKKSLFYFFLDRICFHMIPLTNYLNNAKYNFKLVFEESSLFS